MSFSTSSCWKTRRAEIIRSRRGRRRFSRKHWNLTTARLLNLQTRTNVLEPRKRWAHFNLLLLMESRAPPSWTIIQKLGVTRMKAGEDEMLSVLTNNQEKRRRCWGDDEMQILLLISNERAQLKIRERSRKRRSSHRRRWRRRHHSIQKEGILKLNYCKKVTVIFILQMIQVILKM